MSRFLKSMVIRYRDWLAWPIALAKSLRERHRERRLLARYPGLEIVVYDPAEIAAHRQEGYASQLGQDIYLTGTLLPEGFTGVFVDIGCNHPTKGNNSARLEALGWTGRAFDPQSRFAEAWAAERRTPFVSAAIGAEAGEKEFVEFEVREGWEHELSGFAEYVSPAHQSAMPHVRRRVPTGPLDRLAPDLGPVDLALVDVEGAEMEVLDGLGFERLRPRWLVIENNHDPAAQEALRSRIIGAGYDYVARIGHTDDVFARR